MSSIFSTLTLLLLFLSFSKFTSTSHSTSPSLDYLAGNGGKWKVLRRNIGISAMHVALLPNDKLIAFDRTDFGLSNISLPAGHCRNDLDDKALTLDCSAHSIEFNPVTRSVRPLTVLTDTWCSSGAVSSDGVLIQSGGFNDGDHAVRFYKPCDGCDWEEVKDGLVMRRWYATNALLPDGKIIVVGGRARFDYEFIPKASVYELPFLRRTRDSEENNLYPFVHLLPDGNLFVFANMKSILLDYKRNEVVREFPEMPGNAARNYPSSGSSVLLPLRLDSNDSNNVRAEIMVCGGAEPGSNSRAMKGEFLPAADTCGRLVVTEESPEWEMERMPLRRVMGDMVVLPTGDVLIINGAGKGTAGWGMGRDPVLRPVMYRTASREFEVMNPTKIPRLYHSTAHLLSDGRVVVGGSNPNIRYEFSGVLYPTELSLEAYSPPYLFGGGRPRIVMVEPGLELKYGQRFTVGFRVKKREEGEVKVKVTMVAAAFTTHSFSMNQRVLVLEVVVVSRVSGECYAVDAFAPGTAEVAPPGYYLLHVVHGGVPSRGKWVRVK
ncbi:hypothetical protein J5N97_029369 [Dioscorea zingiberensis]|uniref:Uncharacterized protein n=1 Tax=Dioscorea zingiberensis TaxID=325984 RepID=A0A9D5H5U9_9LILI|nr:hypothetical protein J5N97_029369 [Dioscorea zingiberensis]